MWRECTALDGACYGVSTPVVRVSGVMHAYQTLRIVGAQLSRGRGERIGRGLTERQDAANGLETDVFQTCARRHDVKHPLQCQIVGMRSSTNDVCRNGHVYVDDNAGRWPVDVFLRLKSAGDLKMNTTKLLRLRSPNISRRTMCRQPVRPSNINKNSCARDSEVDARWGCVWDASYRDMTRCSSLRQGAKGYCCDR